MTIYKDKTSALESIINFYHYPRIVDICKFDSDQIIKSFILTNPYTNNLYKSKIETKFGSIKNYKEKNEHAVLNYERILNAEDVTIGSIYSTYIEYLPIEKRYYKNSYFLQALQILVIKKTDQYIIGAPIFPYTHKPLADKGDIYISDISAYAEVWNLIKLDYKFPMLRKLTEEENNFFNIKKNNKISNKTLQRIEKESEKNYIISNPFVVKFRTHMNSLRDRISTLYRVSDENDSN